MTGKVWLDVRSLSGGTFCGMIEEAKTYLKN